MNKSIIGVTWGLAFVVIESIQFVYFGGLFQRMNSFQFGFLVFGIASIAFIGWTALKSPDQLKAALVQPATLIIINVLACIAVAAFLMSVQLIEPAVSYTIGAGTMPLTAYVAYRLGVNEGEAMRNRTEALGNVLLFASIAFLTLATVAGWTGFVRGGPAVAVAGVLCAIADGVAFTVLLIYCQRLSKAGVGAGAVFGLRFPLYVLMVGGIALIGIDQRAPLDFSETAFIIAIGLALTVPPLYALQKAVASISTMTISVISALGPFVIFVLQIIEGRVDYSQATLAGLALYFTAALLAAFAAVRATVSPPARAATDR
ncbi:MAG: hypothetical protein HKN11_07585 [Rhizobiales bacterium]|nr:hypothetical protein [Hyphomicrobiales bacterium]